MSKIEKDPEFDPDHCDDEMSGEFAAKLTGSVAILLLAISVYAISIAGEPMHEYVLLTFFGVTNLIAAVFLYYKSVKHENYTVF